MVKAFLMLAHQKLDKHFKLNRAAVLFTYVKWPCGEFILTLKMIKSDHHSCRSEQQLDDVVHIMVEGPLYRSAADVRKAPKKKKNRDENKNGSTLSSSESFLNLEE